MVHSMIGRRKVLSAMAAGLLLNLNGCGGGNPVSDSSSVDQSGSDKILTMKITDVVIGAGEVAGARQRITVNYTGWFYDVRTTDFHGAKFDSTVDRNLPFIFDSGFGTIMTDLEKGIEGMRVGGKRTLIIPSLKGNRPPSPDRLPLNNAMVFDVELLAVVATYGT